MTEWKRICCAVDFSEPSRVALETAAGLAKAAGATLALVHAYAVPAPVGDFLVTPKDLGTLASGEAERTMRRWQEEAERRVGGPVKTAVVAGDPASEIIRFARAEAADLVVVGTHGRTGLKRLVIGSVAERVVREAPCPVLVARPATDRCG
jgi:nucleotide-binding universal stress UspA family protein